MSWFVTNKKHEQTEAHLPIKHGKWAFFMVPGLVYENKENKKIAIKESDKNSVATATREDNYATLR